MKTKPYLLLVVLLVLMVLPAANAQNCNDYMLLNSNAQYEILTYSNKDKLESKASYHVKDVSRSGDKLEATIQTKVYDNKDKLVSEGAFKVECDGGSVLIDMRSMMNPGMMEAYKDMEMSMEGDKILYPGNLKEGQKLADGTMNITIKDQASGQAMVTMTMSITDRMVKGRESIKVPAGTYDAYKISQNTEVESRAMGMKMPGMRMQTVEYFVQGIGMVRTETYRNGKLISYSVLSKISK